MDPRDSEPLLRQLARLPEPEADLPADELLRAYRRGELPADEEERLERWLARSPGARLRLLALAEPAESAELAELGAPAPAEAVVPAGPGERVRSRVLASFAARGRSRRPARPRWAPAALAALATAAALVLGLGLPWLYRATRAPLPAYQVHLYGGQAEARGAAGEGPRSEIQAFPGQDVRFLVTPVGAGDGGRAGAEVEIGLYRVARGRLERLDGGGFAESREGVVLVRPAAALAGGVPGKHPLYLAVARPGDLPENGAAVSAGGPGGSDGPGSPADIAAALEDGGRRQVSTLYVTILEEEPSFPVRPRGEQP